MSTTLFLIFTLGLHFLADGLAEREFRFAQLNLYFITIEELADYYL